MNKQSFGLYTFHHGLPALFVGYLADNKARARRQIDMLVTQHLLRGGKITMCRPAYAHGVETPIAVRQAVRAGWK